MGRNKRLKEATIDEHVTALQDPGKPIALVFVVDSDGAMRIDYIPSPEWAVEALRKMADQIEQEKL